MTDDYRVVNRAFWDEITPLHVSSNFYATAAFRRGENILDPIVRAGVGDVTGQRLLHLQCHFGLDTLSLARMGAEVTGLDFSKAATETACELAGEAGIPARFIESDVLDPPGDLEDFDIVFASWGTICWVPDVRAWMRVAARVLRPGGRLYLADGHPICAMMDDQGGAHAPFTVRYPYDSPKPLDITGVGDYATPTKVEADRNLVWLHGLERILNGAIDAGFTIARFRELDRVPWRALPQMVNVGDGYWKLPPEAPAFPVGFELIATLG